MKKYHCYIPGCTTYDTISNFMKMPLNDTERVAWLTSIARKDWFIDSSTIICTKHFKQTDFKVLTTYITNNDRKECVTKTLVPINDLSVVPSFFPKVVNGPVDKDHVNNFYPEEMFSLYPRDTKGPDTFAELEEEGKEDFVIDFWYLKLMCGTRLKIHLNGVWKFQANLDYLIFYITDFSEVPRISVTVKIDCSLNVVVSLGGRYVDPADLTWVLPISCKLNRWSQLEAMLKIYGH